MKESDGIKAKTDWVKVEEPVGALAKALAKLSDPWYVVNAYQINGDPKPAYQEFTTLEAAKRYADWMFSNPGWRSVEILQPLAVRLVSNSGRTEVQVACTWWDATTTVKSWQGVIDNRKVTGHPARAVAIINAPVPATSQPTPEDIAMGSWLAAALEDPKVCPSMKFDINCWMDSKIWT